MSNTADWYARKLSQPAAPARRDSTPPVQQTVAVPQPVPYAQPPIPHPSDPQFQAQQRFSWDDMDKDQRFQTILNTVPNEGPGSRDAQACPECGGELLFSQRNASGLRTTSTYPAPHCFNCGWPMIQAGSIGGALGQHG